MNKAEFISKAKELTQYEDVKTPIGVVRVRGLNARDRDAFEVCLQKGVTEDIDIRIRFAIACVVDENGNRLFSEKDRKELSELPGEVFSEIVYAVMRLSGLSPNAVETAKKN